MSNEIATYSMILNKLSLGTSGNECPTKTLILAISSLITISNESTYGANECVRIDDINKEDTPTITYEFGVNPYRVNVDYTGGSGQVTIKSKKCTDGYCTNIDYNLYDSLPSWVSFNKSTSTFTVQPTTDTANRDAKIYFVQAESGKRDYAFIQQTGKPAEPTPSDTYVFTWSDGTTANKLTNETYNGSTISYTVTSTLNGNPQPFGVTSKPDWVTITSITGNNTVNITVNSNNGSVRNGTIVLTQAGSSNTLTLQISQEGKPDPYVFHILLQNEFTDVDSGIGLSVDTSIDSTKDGTYIDYNLTSGSVDWVTVEKYYNLDSQQHRLKITVKTNPNPYSRSTTLVFTQNESGKTQSVPVSQIPGKIDFFYRINDVQQGNGWEWDMPTSSTRKTVTIPVPSGGWSNSDNLHFVLTASPQSSWTSNTQSGVLSEFNSQNYIQITNQDSGITFEVKFLIDGIS